MSVALLLPGAPGRADTLDDGAPAPAESLHPGCFKFDPFRWPAYDPRSCDHWADQCKLIGQSVAENFLITLCLAKCNGVTDRIDPYTWEGCGG